MYYGIFFYSLVHGTRAIADDMVFKGFSFTGSRKNGFQSNTLFYVTNCTESSFKDIKRVNLVTLRHI